MSDLNNTNYAFKNALDLFKDNNVNEALEQLIEILNVYPEDKDSLDLITLIYIKINKPNNAIKFVNRCIALFPEDISYLEKKYKLLTFIGNQNAALDCLQKLNKISPTIESIREISNIYIDKGEIEKSEETIQGFFESNKLYSDLYKGIRHVKAGRNKLAEEAYKNVLKKDKNNVDALRLLGLLAFKQNNYPIAEKLFIRGIQLNPTFKLLWENLAKCFRLQNKFQHAQKAFENLLKLDPNNLEAMGALGTIHIRLSNFDEGIEIYKNLLKQNNQNPRVHLSLGHAQKTVGNRSESEQSYINAIKNFSLCGEAYWSLANLKTYKFSNKQIKSMESALNKNIHEVEKIQMLFALGKAYEANNNFDVSFKYYEEGNWLHRKTLDYNAQVNSDSIEKTIEFFDKNTNKLNYDGGNKTKDPIFILGLPRAGSTLIEQILSSHSLIEGTQEHHNIMTIGRKIRSINNTDNYTDSLFELKDEDILKYGNKYINETIWSRKEKNFFIDKMPNNFPYIGLIKMILPNAKIIDARRNPLDGCFSCFKQFFAKGQHFTYDLDDIARYYKDYERIMLFWNTIFPDSIYKIVYEDVIENPESEVKKLLNYLELDFEKSCMDFYKSKRPVKTASSEQVRQPIYKSGVNYWKNYEDNLTVFKKPFLMMINDKFKYPILERLDTDIGRHYLDSNSKPVPSVTTVLSGTSQSKDGLIQWRNRVGEDEADRIIKQSTDIGTAVHEAIENYLNGKSWDNFEETHDQLLAKKISNKFIKDGLRGITEIWGLEVGLLLDNLYAGTADCVGTYEGIPTLIDFKTAKKIKKREWIEDYFLQGCAYANAHNVMFGTNIEQIVILMVDRNSIFQEFIVRPIEFNILTRKWKKRLIEFNNKYNI